MMEDELARLRGAITECVAERERLKKAMAHWYDAGHRERFPGMTQLLRIDDTLSELDSRFKRQWDAVNTKYNNIAVQK